MDLGNISSIQLTECNQLYNKFFHREQNTSSIHRDIDHIRSILNTEYAIRGLVELEVNIDRGFDNRIQHITMDILHLKIRIE